MNEGIAAVTTMRPNLRLLLMGERAEYRLLVRKHVEIEWPQAVIVEHRLGEDTPLDEHFAASGFDAVVIVGAPPETQPEMLAVALRAQPEFAGTNSREVTAPLLWSYHPRFYCFAPRMAAHVHTLAFVDGGCASWWWQTTTGSPSPTSRG